MAKERTGSGAPPETVISIIGPGMHVVGECTTDGTLRIEGSVQGSVRADGAVEGDVITQDAVISGRISGTLVAESRLELQATCRIDGEVRARRMQLEEGAILNGIVQMGENLQPLERVPVATPAKAAAGPPSVPTAMQTSSVAGARPYQPAGFSDSRNG
jgi:cytoskeletal protein CcmA (bactofilin family)